MNVVYIFFDMVAIVVVLGVFFWVTWYALKFLIIACKATKRGIPLWPAFTKYPSRSLAKDRPHTVKPLTKKQIKERANKK